MSRSAVTKRRSQSGRGIGCLELLARGRGRVSLLRLARTSQLLLGALPVHLGRAEGAAALLPESIRQLALLLMRGHDLHQVASWTSTCAPWHVRAMESSSVVFAGCI